METLWEPIVDAVSMFRNVKIPVLQIYVFELTNTLLGAQLLRQQVDYKMHWLRALILTFIGGIGGNSAAAIFTGNTPRWFNDPSSFWAVMAAYWMVFHCPGDFINRNYTRPALRPVWDFVRGIAIATTIANAVQNALTCKWSNGLPSSVHTCIVAGTLAAGGGALIQEYLNLLLLPQDMLKRPASGPAFPAYLAIICSCVHVLVLRDPTGFTAGLLRSVGLPPVLPLAQDTRHALPLLCLLTIPLQMRSWFPQPATARQISEALAAYVPGFKPVLIPSEIGSIGSTRPAGVLHVDCLGYERLPAAPSSDESSPSSRTEGGGGARAGKPGAYKQA